MHTFEIRKEEIRDIKYLCWHVFMNIRWCLFYHWNIRNFNRFDRIIDIYEHSTAFSFFESIGINVKRAIIRNGVENFDNVTVTVEDIQRYPVLREKYFICVANFDQNKNQEMLVDAFHRMPSNDNVHLVLIGRHSAYTDMIVRKVDALNLNKLIHVYTDLPRDITVKLMKKAYCGIMSSRKEVYPIFISEMLACHHPYVSTDVGYVSQIPGGVIVRTVSEMALAMKSLLDDVNRRNELADIGYTYAKLHFSQTQKVDELENCLLKTIDGEG